MKDLDPNKIVRVDFDWWDVYGDVGGSLGLDEHRTSDAGNKPKGNDMKKKQPYHFFSPKNHVAVRQFHLLGKILLVEYTPALALDRAMMFLQSGKILFFRLDRGGMGHIRSGRGSCTLEGAFRSQPTLALGEFLD